LECIIRKDAIGIVTIPSRDVVVVVVSFPTPNEEEDEDGVGGTIGALIDENGAYIIDAASAAVAAAASAARC
jgi:hypothetical protein